MNSKQSSRTLLSGYQGNGVVIFILAGGEGTRMQASSDPEIRSTPKVLLQIMQDGSKTTILDYLIGQLSLHGFERVAILAGLGPRRGGLLVDRHVSSRYGMSAYPKIYLEESPLGSAGAVCSALHHADADIVVVLPGDIIFPFECLHSAIDFHVAGAASLTWIVTTRDAPEAQNKGLIIVDPIRRLVVQSLEGKITQFDGSVSSNYTRATSTGVVILTRERSRKMLHDYYDANRHPPMVDLYGDFLPWVIDTTHEVWAFDIQHPVFDLGTPERFEPFRKRES